MSAKAPKRITDEKRAKIGVDGYLNIDKGTFVAKSERAIQAAKKKDPNIIYDSVFGLVSTSQDAIDDFIEFNDLTELDPDVLEAPVVAKVSASASASASSVTSAKSSSSRDPKSNDFIQKVTDMLQNLKNPAKFLNISTMREVNGGKKDLVYNHGRKIAAREVDRKLLDEVSIALGGSPSGGLGRATAISEAESQGDQSQSSIEPPGATRNRMVSRTVTANGRHVYGRPVPAEQSASAIPASSTTSSSAMITLPEDDMEERKGEEVVQSMKKLEISSRPSMIRPLTKPDSLPFAIKKPLNTVFTIAKPE